MNSEDSRIDITNTPELARLAEEVRASRRPLYLQKDGETLAVVMPVGRRRTGRRRPATPADERAFRAAAGSWKGLVDPEALKAQLKAARGSDRPPARL